MYIRPPLARIDFCWLVVSGDGISSPLSSIFAKAKNRSSYREAAEGGTSRKRAEGKIGGGGGGGRRTTGGIGRGGFFSTFSPPCSFSDTRSTVSSRYVDHRNKIKLCIYVKCMFNYINKRHHPFVCLFPITAAAPFSIFASAVLRRRSPPPLSNWSVARTNDTRKRRGREGSPHQQQQCFGRVTPTKMVLLLLLCMRLRREGWRARWHRSCAGGGHGGWRFVSATFLLDRLQTKMNSWIPPLLLHKLYKYRSYIMICR